MWWYIWIFYSKQNDNFNLERSTNYLQVAHPVKLPLPWQLEVLSTVNNSDCQCDLYSRSTQNWDGKIWLLWASIVNILTLVNTITNLKEHLQLNGFVIIRVYRIMFKIMTKLVVCEAWGSVKDFFHKFDIVACMAQLDANAVIIADDPTGPFEKRRVSTHGSWVQF